MKYRKFMFRGTSAKRYALKQESLIFTTRMKILRKLLKKRKNRTINLWLQTLILILMMRIVAASKKMMVAKCREVYLFLPL